MIRPRSERTVWSKIKHRVLELNSEFYAAFEKVSPPDSLPLLTVKYPYGFKLSDEKSFYLPEEDLSYLEDGGFDKHAPLTFVLKNKIEYFYDPSNSHVISRINEPGSFFPITQDVELEPENRFAPKSIMTVTSGIRDITLLSLQSQTADFINLRRKYSISPELTPEKPLNHFEIIKTIIEKEKIDWHSEVLVFSNEWKKEIDQNPAWWPVKQYLLESSLKQRQYDLNAFYLQQAIHDITRSLEFKYRPYIHEIIKEVILIATGVTPGFRPSTDERGFPLKAITEIIADSSRQLLLYPVFMEASSMSPSSRNEYIYTSITYNTSINYALSLQNLNSYLEEIIINLHDHLQRFKSHLLTKGTIYEKLYDNLDIVACSARGSKVKGVLKAEEIYSRDPSFNYPQDILKTKARNGMPTNAVFSKAFIGLKWKS